MGLGLPLPRVLVSHGMVLADGQKMSKSIGNVINPVEVLDKYGLDAFRYFFLRHVDTFADSDFTWEKFENAYNNELANDLGNLVQRLAAMCAKNQITLQPEAFLTGHTQGRSAELMVPKGTRQAVLLPISYIELMDRFEYSRAFDYVWEQVQGLNKRIDEEKPWVLAKECKTKELEKCLTGLVRDLLNVNLMLQPFIPSTCDKIREVFAGEIKPPEIPLFPKQ